MVSPISKILNYSINTYFLNKVLIFYCLKSFILSAVKVKIGNYIPMY